MDIPADTNCEEINISNISENNLPEGVHPIELDDTFGEFLNPDENIINLAPLLYEKRFGVGDTWNTQNFYMVPFYVYENVIFQTTSNIGLSDKKIEYDKMLILASCHEYAFLFKNALEVRGIRTSTFNDPRFEILLVDEKYVMENFVPDTFEYKFYLRSLSPPVQTRYRRRKLYYLPFLCFKNYNNNCIINLISGEITASTFTTSFIDWL